MKTILAFGDSNTWGLIPGTADRYPWGIRWTSVLQEKVQKNHIRIIEEGLCGRTTVFEDELRSGRKGLEMLPVLLESHASLDGAVVMLGTNDCKSVYHASPHVIGMGIELCLNELEHFLPPERILLVSPILLGEEVWKPDKDPEFSRESVLTCKQLKAEYRAIAEKRGTAFLAASDYAAASSIDEEHLTEAGHRALAEAVYEKLGEMKLL